MEEVYYNKLIALMKSTTKYADTYRIDDTFIEREKELLSKQLDYLCDDRFLLYLSTQVKEDKNDNIK